MTWQTFAIMAAIAGTFAGLRDIVGAFRKARQRLTEAERAAIREPIEVRTLVLDSTKQAVELQSAVLLQVRNSLIEAEKRAGEAEAERDRLRDENRRLLIQLGRAHMEDGK